MLISTLKPVLFMSGFPASLQFVSSAEEIKFSPILTCNSQSRFLCRHQTTVREVDTTTSSRRSSVEYSTRHPARPDQIVELLFDERLDEGVSSDERPCDDDPILVAILSWIGGVGAVVM